MSDEYTEVSSESWFSRLWGSITGVLIGLLLFLGAFPLLFWNEGRAVERARSLEEGAKAVVSVEAETVDPADDGKLVHVTGRAVASDSLMDPIFGISVSALKFRRSAEMYQWIEEQSEKTEKQTGGSEKTVTTYSYRKAWKDQLIESDEFKKPGGHENPGSMPYSDWSRTAQPITVGAYQLPRSMTRQLAQYETLVPSSDQKAAIEEEHGLTAQDRAFYSGQPGAPSVGDVRVRFAVVEPGPVSIVARQIENTFESYRTSNGRTLEMLHTGTRSADAMFEAAQSTNTFWTWVLRVGGFVLMMGGLSMIFRPLVIVADVVPFVGSLLESGLGIVSLLIAAPLTLVTIATGWIFYRPLVGAGLLVVALAVVGVAIWYQNRDRPASSGGTTAGAPA